MERLELQQDPPGAVTQLDRLVHRLLGDRTVGGEEVVGHLVVAGRQLEAEPQRDVPALLSSRIEQPGAAGQCDVAEARAR